jgi:formate hydrogenlyase transcriptional activator
VVPAAVMDTLMRWHWPGNIRELQNTVERAVILSTGDTMALPGALMNLAEPRGPRRERDPEGEARERHAILAALKDAGGIVAGPAGAAARLGLKRTTLLARMRRLGVSRGQA